MVPNLDKTVQLRLTQEQHRRLQRRARRQNITTSALLRVLVESELSEPCPHCGGVGHVTELERNRTWQK